VTQTLVDPESSAFEQLNGQQRAVRNGHNLVVVSKPTVGELIRVLTYAKFDLDKVEIEALLADYLPFTAPVVVAPQPQSPRCKDSNDQRLVDLFIQGRAGVLVTGDRALLQMDFGVAIEQAADYRRRLQRA
jgi:predicted nucleic acid-binding protein